MAMSTSALLIGMCSVLAFCLSAPTMGPEPAAVTTNKTSSKKILACYFIPADYGVNETQIDPFLCTHIMFASALVSPQGIKARGPKDIISWKLLIKLKKKNPDLKIMLSLKTGFETVVGKGSAVINSFINGSKTLLDKYDMDGVDLHWEYPGAEQKEAYSVFIQDLANSLQAQGKVLSLATPHDVDTFLAGYDPTVVNEYVDFLTVMTYDYYIYSKANPYVEFYSPLDKAAVSINNYLTKAKINASKLLLGFPTHGGSWKLADPEHNHTYHSKVVGGGDPSRPPFPHVCLMYVYNSTSWIDGKRGAEYLVNWNNGDWVSYSGIYSAVIEATWVRDNGIGGVGFDSLTDSDFTNFCDYGYFPLFNTIKKILTAPF